MQNKMERLTRRARKAISQAQELAFEMQSAEIEPYHLLLVLCRIDGSASQAILDDFDIIDVKLSPLIHVRYQTKSKSSSHPLNQHRVILSDAVKQTLELSVDSARRLNAHNIGTEHLLEGIVRCDSQAIADILKHFRVSPEDIIERIEYYTDNPAVQKTPTLAPTPSYETRQPQEKGCFGSILSWFGIHSDD